MPNTLEADLESWAKALGSIPKRTCTTPASITSHIFPPALLVPFHKWTPDTWKLINVEPPTNATARFVPDAAQRKPSAPLPLREIQQGGNIMKEQNILHKAQEKAVNENHDENTRAVSPSLSDGSTNISANMNIPESPMASVSAIDVPLANFATHFVWVYNISTTVGSKTILQSIRQYGNFAHIAQTDSGIILAYDTLQLASSVVVAVQSSKPTALSVAHVTDTQASSIAGQRFPSAVLQIACASAKSPAHVFSALSECACLAAFDDSRWPLIVCECESLTQIEKLSHVCVSRHGWSITFGSPKAKSDKTRLGVLKSQEIALKGLYKFWPRVVSYDSRNVRVAYLRNDATEPSTPSKLELSRRPRAPPGTSVEETVDLTGMDGRTTVMLRNIPNKMTSTELVAWLNKQVPREFDFVYLRFDFKSRCNVGYAFVNFTKPATVGKLFSHVLNTRWDIYSSDKTVRATYATVQGLSSLVDKFRNSPVMDEDIKVRPMIFHTSGECAGLPAIFPKCTQPVQKLRSSSKPAATTLWTRKHR